MSVYGNQEQNNISEISPYRADTPLAQSRIDVERLITAYAQKHGIWSMHLRPRFIVGEGDHFFLPGLHKLFKRSISIGDGAQQFNIIDVGDYANIVLSLAKHIQGEQYPQQTALNIGYEQPVCLRDIENVLCSTSLLPRFRIPVSTKLIKFLKFVLPRSSGLCEKLALLGYSHVGDVRKLKCFIGSKIIGRNPLTRIAAASERLRSPQRSALAETL